VISSTMPSTKYSCSGSPLILANGSDKAIAAPGDRLDAAALRAAIVKDTAKGHDLHRQVAYADPSSS
jgi:hypothetical protein